MKSRKLIERLFSEGRYLNSPPFKVFYLYIDAAAWLQAGFTVSAKNFKRAVDRNRIKRLTREAYRLQKIFLYNRLREKNRQLAVFFIYTGKELPAYDLVYKKMGIILKKLSEISNEDNIEHT